MERVTRLQTKVLRTEASPGEADLYRAALEWDLIDPIVIEKREDLKSEARWHGQIEPFHHQVTNLMTFCRRLPVTLLADDVGLGKTISAGLIVSELAARSRVEKILVVAPKLLGPQWKEEIETKFNIPAEIAIGKELKTANPEGLGVVITTYNSARLYLEKLPPDRFQMLILDEAHKLRNLYGTDKAPQVAVKFRKALAERRFRYVLMLTATPLQNRLWDLYSLVDLLSVARGHENPFGAEGMFYRRFIDDDRDKARKLKPQAKGEFQSIVYGYMSRVRRGDAKLYFPDRVVRMERVQPSQGELDLIAAIAKPIQNLNRLAQISILQALASSPEALSHQLQNSAKNGTIPRALAEEVKTIVASMPITAKLKALGALIDRLKKESPDRWRLVIFTTRRETQTTIEAFLSERGLKIGLINGDTGGRNQNTLASFRANPPQLNVIVSTEAGAEGVNLQVANVLVNYDLPWNPMIVEQRIGRIQRLASQHAHVSIFNMTLVGTFEEYIVGRLMEKLQLASHAIGDIESLLQASGVTDDDEGGDFEETIRQLVVAALAGKDVEADARLAAESIENAKAELAKGQDAIDAMLGNMDGSNETGPQAPKLPPVDRSMDASQFVLASYKQLGGAIITLGPDYYRVDQVGTHHEILLSQDAQGSARAVLHIPGSAAFSRLVTRVAGSGVHRAYDKTEDAEAAVAEVCAHWLHKFGAVPKKLIFKEVEKSFEGTATVRVRAIVQYDSYERLITLPCDPTVHRSWLDRSGLRKTPPIIEAASSVGIDEAAILAAVELDPGISEFSRFYLERREIEVKAAGDDQRKQHKLWEDFTPRLEATVVGLSGRIGRKAEVEITYRLDGDTEYSDVVEIDADGKDVLREPEFGTCGVTKRSVPVSALERCRVTSTLALRHKLVQSEASGRYALPEFAVKCALSGQTILKEEAEASSITGALVLKALLRTSAISGRRAEPAHFGRCEFTNADVLTEELSVSQISGKRYRSDQSLKSAVSQKIGHRQEFVECHETRQPITIEEAEKCEVSGVIVRPGILASCAVTKKRVLPSELRRCSLTDQMVLPEFLVTSSVSARTLLKSAATRSVHTGRYCFPTEEATCSWSGRNAHPDDIVQCALAGLPINRDFATKIEPFKLKPLAELVDGTRHDVVRADLWPVAAERLAKLVKGKLRPEASCLSPDDKKLAVRCEVRTLMGLRSKHISFILSVPDSNIIGRLVEN
jgi:superfamily II DNA or RNA helicase